jgi:hypothetical protein
VTINTVFSSVLIVGTLAQVIAVKVSRRNPCRSGLRRKVEEMGEEMDAVVGDGFSTKCCW